MAVSGTAGPTLGSTTRRAASTVLGAIVLGAIVLGSIVLLAACSPAPTPARTDTAGVATGSNDAAIRQTIERIDREFPAIARARNADSAAAWFAPDAIVYANGMPAVRGRDAIRQFYNGFFQAIPIQDMTFTTEAITPSGDLAIETGTNTLVVGAPGQAGTAVAGKYLAVWKRQPDGRWLLWRHSPSSNVMPAR